MPARGGPPSARPASAGAADGRSGRPQVPSRSSSKERAPPAAGKGSSPRRVPGSSATSERASRARHGLCARGARALPPKIRRTRGYQSSPTSRARRPPAPPLRRAPLPPPRRRHPPSSPFLECKIFYSILWFREPYGCSPPCTYIQTSFDRELPSLQAAARAPSATATRPAETGRRGERAARGRAADRGRAVQGGQGRRGHPRRARIAKGHGGPRCAR